MDNQYWYFTTENRQLSFPPHTELETGKTYSATGPLMLYTNGIHASVRAIDAARCSLGAVACRVQLTGNEAEMLMGNNAQIYARNMTVLWMADASKLMHDLACVIAQNALVVSTQIDPCLTAAIATKRAYVLGECSNDALQAARRACRNIAMESASNARWIDSKVANVIASALYPTANVALFMAADATAEMHALTSALRITSDVSVEDRATMWQSIYQNALTATITAHNTEFERLLMEIKPSNTKL